MTLRDILNKLLRRQEASANMARERLQLVLAHDRTDLSPDLLDQMRREILEVVAKYVEIDIEDGAVSLETEDQNQSNELINHLNEKNIDFEVIS